MLKYKVLNNDLTSPYKHFQYEINKLYVCEDFDESNKICSKGFYVTDIEGLLHTYRPRLNTHKVFEVDVSGRERIFNQFKQRFEKQTIIREVSDNEIKKLIKAESEKLNYDLYHAIYPFNPLKDIKVGEVTEEINDLLKQWDSVRDSIMYSVENSVRDSVGDSVIANTVRDSVGDSVWDSVGDSVWGSIRNSVWGSIRNSVGDSVWAYISSMFPNIKKWQYIEHAEGINPFQCGIDLWVKGFVPSFDGKTWRLHSGPNAKIVYEKEI